MNENKIKDLAACIVHWLNFQKLCGRNTLFSESYLNQPLGEFLLFHHSGELISEYNHPNLNIEKKIGRPNQIDFALLSRDLKNPTTLVELKWLDKEINESTLVKNIVYDLLRLEIANNKQKSKEANTITHKYFLLAGYNEITFAFVNEKLNCYLSSLKDGLMIIETESPETLDICKSFQEKFQERGVLVPKRFETKMITNYKSNDFEVFIWRITSSKNRQTASF